MIIKGKEKNEFIIAIGRSNSIVELFYDIKNLDLLSTSAHNIIMFLHTKSSTKVYLRQRGSSFFKRK